MDQPPSAPRPPRHARIRRWAVRATVTLLLALAAFLLGIGLVTRTFPDLAPPLQVELSEEFTARRDGGRLDLDGYLALEDRLFAELDRSAVVHGRPSHDRIFDRYLSGSPSDPARFPRNWNRTQVEVPAHPRGAALLLHGLSDSPYSLRSVGRIYADQGFAVITLRLPGHGTVPTGILHARWEDWAAATRLALDRTVELAGDGPLHVVGYSNGALLALLATLERLEEPESRVPDRIVLLSPAIGIPEMARFARWVKLIAWIPPFRKASWQDVATEVDPFKYSSFPFNASYQCWRGTRVVRDRLERAHRRGALASMPPVLAFASVVDATVISPAVQYGLFDRLPANGSELVLFDINRIRSMTLLFPPGTLGLQRWNLEPFPRDYTLTLITNRSPETLEVVCRTFPPGGGEPVERPTGLAWPDGTYSLSHVAVPFPPDDPIYGDGTSPSTDPLLHLGSLSLKGESGQLQIPLSLLYRLRHNPFHPLMASMIRDTITTSQSAGSTTPSNGDAVVY